MPPEPYNGILGPGFRARQILKLDWFHADTPLGCRGQNYLDPRCSRMKVSIVPDVEKATGSAAAEMKARVGGSIYLTSIDDIGKPIIPGCRYG